MVLHGGPEHVGLGVEDLRPLVQRAGGEDLVEQADQLGRVLAAAHRGGEAVVGQPFGVSDDPGQRRPVALTLLTDQPECPTVAGGVVVHGRVAHRLSVGRSRCEPPSRG